MIDLHTHSIFSDGELIPSELARRAQALGLEAIGITDHVDLSNLDFVIPRLVTVAKALNDVNEITVIPGAELTHVPPGHISALAEKARALGARIVIVHGETIAEPVAPGTNRAAVDADIDILAHPGLISEQDVVSAAQQGILLEISGRKGHCLTNGHVAKLAKRHGAKMVLNTDAHAPCDLMDGALAGRVALGAGLSPEDFEAMQQNARSLL